MTKIKKHASTRFLSGRLNCAPRFVPNRPKTGLFLLAVKQRGRNIWGLLAPVQFPRSARRRAVEIERARRAASPLCVCSSCSAICGGFAARGTACPAGSVSGLYGLTARSVRVLRIPKGKAATLAAALLEGNGAGARRCRKAGKPPLGGLVCHGSVCRCHLRTPKGGPPWRR